MGPQNVIVLATTSPGIMAFIDWGFVASAPYASLHCVIGMLFRRLAITGFCDEYADAEEMRNAF
jgi:hypothetical protein